MIDGKHYVVKIFMVNNQGKSFKSCLSVQMFKLAPLGIADRLARKSCLSLQFCRNELSSCFLGRRAACSHASKAMRKRGRARVMDGRNSGRTSRITTIWHFESRGRSFVLIPLGDPRRRDTTTIFFPFPAPPQAGPVFVRRCGRDKCDERNAKILSTLLILHRRK